MKLSSWTYYVIGLSLSLIILSFGFFNQFMPNMEEARFYADNFEALKTEAAKMKQAEQRVENAKQMVEEKASAWRRIVAARTPSTDINAGGVSLAVDAFQLSVNTRIFRNAAQRAVNTQLRAGGVRVLNGPVLPDIDPNIHVNQILPTFYNYPALPFPVLIWELGAITVQGTYRQITDHVKAWSNMPRYLAVADGLALSGTSPVLTGTYNLTIVGFVRGKDIFPTIIEAAGGGVAAGPLGGVGGPPMFGAGPPPGFGGGPPNFGGGPPAGFGGPPGTGVVGAPPAADEEDR